METITTAVICAFLSFQLVFAEGIDDFFADVAEEDYRENECNHLCDGIGTPDKVAVAD